MEVWICLGAYVLVYVGEGYTYDKRREGDGERELCMDMKAMSSGFPIGTETQTKAASQSLSPLLAHPSQTVMSYVTIYGVCKLRFHSFTLL